MLCSIVVPAFNARAFLANAVRSALAQEGADVEVVIVDDRSQDDTLAIAKGLADEDARVNVLQTGRNAGPGVARNLAYAAARGEWVAVLDADDTYHPARIRRLAALGAASGADLVADNLLIRSEDEELNDQPVFSARRLPTGPLSADRFVRGNITAASDSEPSYGLLKPLVRRAFVERHGITYPPLRFAEDFIFYARCLACGGSLQVLQDAFYHYAVHSGSLTFSSRLDDIAALLDEEKRLLESQDLDPRSPLAAALRDHLQSVQRGYDWRRFAESLKARRWTETALLLSRRPSVALRALGLGLERARARSGAGAAVSAAGELDRAYRGRRRSAANPAQLKTPHAGR